jgi:molecular chaperone GrpE
MKNDSSESTTGKDFKNIDASDNASRDVNPPNNLSEETSSDDANSSQENEPIDEHTDAETQDFLTRLGLKGKPKKEIIELKNKLEETNDKYLRLLAEFENAKRRQARERLDLYKTAGQDILLSLLPVLDDFERALKQIDQAKDVQAFREGVTLIHDKFKNILEQKGLKGLNSIGQDFNVEHHEAITEIPAPSEELKGKVVDELERGYTLHDKMIRFAKVIVGK